jgi:hypothetical protein
MPAPKVYAEPQRAHVSLGGPLRTLLFLVPVIALAIVLAAVAAPRFERTTIAVAGVIEVVFGIVWGTFISGVRIAAQWERGVVLRLGRFRPSGVRG